MTTKTTSLLILATCHILFKSTDAARLVFSFDQGFGNGAVEQFDRGGSDAISSMAKTLLTSFPGHEPIALLNPMLKNHTRFDAVLDLLDQAGLPFILDVYTSDAITLGSCSAQNAPFNNSLGLSASFDRLASLKQRFVRSFLGLRIMEVFSMDFTIRAVRTTNPDWALPCWRRVVLASNTSFFQESLLHDVLSFSREHGLFVQFSDWHWSTFAPWDAPLKAQEISLANILRDYPNLAIVTYANNEPGGASATRLRNWQQALASFSAWSDYGLSDQGWLCDNNCSKPACPCPPSAIVAWAVSAVNQSEYIQFEPAWEHFDLPAGTFEDSSFAGKTGHPLPVFAAVVRALGVASVSGI